MGRLGPDRARELGRLGGLAKAEKLRARQAPPEPLDGTILDACTRLGFDGPSWAAWRAFLRSLFGLPLAPEELATYRQHTGREDAPAAPGREAWVVVGRRGDKSRVAALVAVFMATFRDYRAVLAPGERGVVMCLAADRQQARVVFRYVVGLLESVPELRRLIRRQRQEAVELHNGVAIEVHTASYRTTRGYTLVAALLDETAFWRSEDSANPDVEVVGALRPGLATVPGSLLLGISTPYARRGELWRVFERHFGKASAPVLVWRAATADMNPAVDPRVIEDAYAEDPVAAAAEYGGEFRRDVETVFGPEALEAVRVAGRRELPPQGDVDYAAFVDPSGGSQDSFTLAIAHAEGPRAVLDCVRERRAPFSPDAVTAELCAVLRTYGVRTVWGDRYAGEWPRERFAAHGIGYRPSEHPKSELYKALVPAVNAARVELLDEPRFVLQLAGLERRTARGGRDSIDHPPGGHDDVANAAAGALVAVVERFKRASIGGAVAEIL